MRTENRIDVTNSIFLNKNKHKDAYYFKLSQKRIGVEIYGGYSLYLM